MERYVEGEEVRWCLVVLLLGKWGRWYVCVVVETMTGIRLLDSALFSWLPSLFFFLIFTWEYICSLILEREEGRERERDIDVREKHWLVTSRKHPSQALNLQLRYESCLGIQPAAFLCTDWHSSRLSHPARAGYQFLVTSYSSRFYSLILLFMSSKIRLNQVIWRLRNHQIFCNPWWSWGFLSSLLIVGIVT